VNTLHELTLIPAWGTAAILVVVAVWEIILSTRKRNRHDPTLPILVPGLVLLALTATVGIHSDLLAPVRHVLPAVVFSGFVNGAWMAMAYCFAAYFVMANDQRPLAVRTRRVFGELAVFTAALLTMVLVQATAAPGVFSAHPDLEQFRSWQNILFYVSDDGYALAAWSFGVWRGIRYLRGSSSLWATWTVGIVVAGAASSTFGVDVISLVQQGWGAAVGDTGPDWLVGVYAGGQLVGQVLLAIGLGLVPAVTVLIRRKARRDDAVRERLKPALRRLWRLITTEVVWVRLNPADTDVDFEDMITETTDGLAQLARECWPSDADTRDVQVAAEMVTSALRRLAARRDASGLDAASKPAGPPFGRIEPDFGPRWKKRARWMVGVERELERQGVIERELESYGGGMRS
jgi:hypothetical protein